MPTSGPYSNNRGHSWTVVRVGRDPVCGVTSACSIAETRSLLSAGDLGLCSACSGSSTIHFATLPICSSRSDGDCERIAAARHVVSFNCSNYYYYYYHHYYTSSSQPSLLCERTVSGGSMLRQAAAACQSSIITQQSGRWVLGT